LHCAVTQTMGTEEGMPYEVPTSRYDGEGRAGPQKTKNKFSKRNAKPYARTVCYSASFNHVSHDRLRNTQ
jgi:hypothetical protein